MRLREEIRQLKEEISLEEFLLFLGAHIRSGTWETRWGGEWTTVTCPFHYDTTPSARFSRSSGRFKCFDAGCDVSGDIVDLAKVHLDTRDTREAIDWLERTFREPR